MVVTCPHCHASYRLAATIRNAVLVCHRCGKEFTPETPEQQAEMPNEAKAEMPSLFDWRPPAEHEAPAAAPAAERKEITREPLSPEEEELPHFLLKEHHMVKEPAGAAAPASAETAPQPSHAERDSSLLAAAHEQEQAMLDAAAAPAAPAAEEPPADETAAPAPEEVSTTDFAAPTRRNTRIWPWLVFILLSAGAAGLWFKQDLWLQNLWVRSTLLNTGAPLPLQTADWLITPESVHSQWLVREDNSRILIIEGEVENRLFCELPPPAIRVELYDLPGAQRPLESRTLPITEPPSLAALKKAPYARPGRDRLPMAGEGRRGFVLVLESLPKGIRDFALTPVAPE